LAANPDAGETTVVYSGTNLEVRTPNPDVWYKATFTLREDRSPRQLFAVITECPFPQLVGRTANAIYRFEKGDLRMAARQPGDEMPLNAFGDPTASEYVLKRVE